MSSMIGIALIIHLVSFSLFLAQYSKHLFVHINETNTLHQDPLESIDIRQICDKFPETNGGLRDLFDNGPKEAFFLVKFWVSKKFHLLTQVLF